MGLTVSQETISFSLDTEKRKALDEIASVFDRDRSDLLNEAIDSYLQVYQWQLDHIKEGLQQADTGEFASDEEVAAAFAEVIERLEADGWYLARTKGSHRQFKHPTKLGTVTVPGKLSKDLAIRTLMSIWKQAQLEDE